MRRFISYIGVILLSLLLSGGGSVLAATCCPHNDLNQPTTVAEDRSGCHATLEKTGVHHPESRHEPAVGAKTTRLEIPQLQNTGRIALSQPTAPCTHCVDRNEIPATSASIQGLTREQRDGRLIRLTKALAPSPATRFFSKITPTQHAPPGVIGRKHLLLNVFLI